MLIFLHNASLFGEHTSDNGNQADTERITIQPIT